MAGENTQQEKAPPPLPDPFEKTNRQVYVFNQQFEKKIAEPVVKAYDKAVPEPAKESVKNFLSNASLPMSFFNSLFQGDGTNALAAFSHLLINTTVGIGGLFDVASKKEIRFDKRTFSQTLGKYGVGAGPYLVIPFIGPSSSRDLLGYAADKALDPTSFNVTGAGGAAGSVIGSNYSIAMFMASGVDRRESIISAVEKIRNQSFDPYAIMKTIYSRNRPAEVKKE
jgi:phospholipid-binding lipoprotein MlaA